MTLQIEDLRVTAPHGLELVHGIDVEVQPGEWFALGGESGSGKSVTAHAIGDLLPVGLTRTARTLRLGQHDLLTQGRRQMRRIRGTEICYVFQNYAGAFSPYHRIGAHMTEALGAHGTTNSSAYHSTILTALEEVGLDPEATANRYPFQLSGGQLQRVVLATAVMARPRLLIADEPTTALDAVTQADVLARIDQLRASTGCAVLFITHDLRCVRTHADRMAVLRHGEIVEQGTVAEITARPSHPYTRGLLAALPPIDRDLDRLPVTQQGA
ncbi:MULTISPECIES: ABC transporter ATP-binding protein [unclassified Luteococcus]|uniref:ABC transporter ATP-binding protein n=1 Tax=unclassified Luteococcus TaxID=2639923 RepID=UPI00313F35D0